MATAVSGHFKWTNSSIQVDELSSAVCENRFFLKTRYQSRKVWNDEKKRVKNQNKREIAHIRNDDSRISISFPTILNWMAVQMQMNDPTLNSYVRWRSVQRRIFVYFNRLIQHLSLDYCVGVTDIYQVVKGKQNLSHQQTFRIKSSNILYRPHDRSSSVSAYSSVVPSLIGPLDDWSLTVSLALYGRITEPSSPFTTPHDTASRDNHQQ